MTKIAAYGSILSKNDVDTAQVKNISGPGMSLDTEDVTTHDQATAWEEVVATVLRSGEITLEIVYDPADASQVDLLFDLDAKATDTWALEFQDVGQTAWSFTGYVTRFEPGAPVEGALTASVTIKVTGVIDLVDTWT